MDKKASSLTALPNIGKVIAEQLTAAGIDTPEKLREAGSRAAFLRIQAFDPSACINRLMALEGAVQDIRWHSLTPTCKAELREFYHSARVR